MDKKIREIIDREKVVILCFALLGALFLFIAKVIPEESPTYIYKCSMGGKTSRLEMPTFNGVEDRKGKLDMYILLKKYSIREARAVKFTPKDFEIEYLGEHYTLIGNVRNAALYLSVIMIFIFYPVYLFLRYALFA